MAKLPTAVSLFCESCGKQHRAQLSVAKRPVFAMRRIDVRENGECKECSGNSWTLSVVYREGALDNVAIGMVLAAASAITGPIGAFLSAFAMEWTTDSNESRYPRIPAGFGAKLNAEPRLRKQRIEELVGTIERGALFAAGGKVCGTCEAVFVPSADRTWSQLGYCSRVCAADSDADSPVFVEQSGQTAAENRFNTKVDVICPNGHSFYSSRSFVGHEAALPDLWGKNAGRVAVDDSRADGHARADRGLTQLAPSLPMSPVPKLYHQRQL